MEMPESKFCMWRCVFAVASVDGVISTKEHEWMWELLRKLKLSRDQSQLLQREIKQPSRIDNLVSKVTEPADRAQLVHLCRVMAHLDELLMEDEASILSTLKEAVEANVDEAQTKRELAEVMTKAKALESQKDFRLKIADYFSKIIDAI